VEVALKKPLAVLVVFLMMIAGVVFFLSCGGGGGGGEAEVDLDMDGFNNSVDCNDNASSCTDDCTSDVDEDGTPDCLDLCLDVDSDGYGLDNSFTIVGSGSDDVDACTQNGTLSCDRGDPCLDLDCDDDETAGVSINPGTAELCEDEIDNNCDGLTDCYDETICAPNAACSACNDADGDGYFALNALCSGGDDCNDLNAGINPGGIGVFGCPSPICSACDNDEDCGTENRCVSLDNALVCAADCSNAGTCPESYTCTELGDDRLCIPNSGSCDCFPADDGEERACFVANAHGTCTGTETCDSSSGWAACTALTPAAETCDGLDNDCDGGLDEGFADLGNACTVGAGECLRSGTRVCTNDGTGTECNAVPGLPDAEICDGQDDDCDGQVDENLSAPLCPKQNGVCAGARTTCGGVSGWLACVAANYGPNYEDVEVTCDGLDNDCDGTVDEATCAAGTPCTGSSQCASGFCTDGYCCNTACLGTCQSCGVNGMVGTCAYYSSGADPENECAGTCDGAGGCI
jgi:hypothetical protein